MSGRQVFLASSVPLSKRFAKLEKAPQRTGGGGGGTKKAGVKASANAGAPGRNRQDKARQTASKSREFAAASKRGLGGAPMKAAKAVKQQEKRSKNAAAAAGGAGRAGKKGDQSKVARLTGKKTVGTIKAKKPGKGKDAARKGDAKPVSKEDLEYQLDRYRCVAEASTGLACGSRSRRVWPLC